MGTATFQVCRLITVEVEAESQATLIRLCCELAKEKFSADYVHYHGGSSDKGAILQLLSITE